MKKPSEQVKQAAAAYHALCSADGQWTSDQHREARTLAKVIAESGHCPNCAAEDGSLQRLCDWEESQNPEEYSGSECGTCEEFVVWGRQCELEFVTCDDGHSDADPGL
jgi:hypothetical protein